MHSPQLRTTIDRVFATKNHSTVGPLRYATLVSQIATLAAAPNSLEAVPGQFQPAEVA